MKRILLILTIFFASCRTFVPAPPANPGGVYQGFDSVIYNSNTIYGNPGIGNCLTLKPLNDGCFIFQNIVIRPISTSYEFDTTYNVEYHADSVTRKIHKIGTYTFGYNYMKVEYYVGEKGKDMSQYKFIGWKN